MKTTKKILSILVVASVVLGAAGCKKKEKDFSNKSIEKVMEEYDIEAYDDVDEYTGSHPEGTDGQPKYLMCSGDDAQDAYDAVINRLNQFPDYAVKELFHTMGISGKEAYTIYMITLESEKKAEEMYKKMKKKLKDEKVEESTKDKSGYNYILIENKSAIGGLYQSRDKVIYVYGTIDSDGQEIISDVCSKLGIVAPEDAQD